MSDPSVHHPATSPPLPTRLIRDGWWLVDRDPLPKRTPANGLASIRVVSEKGRALSV